MVGFFIPDSDELVVVGTVKGMVESQSKAI
jgi:hypothetical protein